ncbi:MAG: CRISPR-associated protein Cas4 [Candidatus Woesearchaeota archaeon]
MRDVVIGASWFLTQGYCEYKLYLEKVLGVTVPKTQEMLVGSAIHKRKEVDFLKKAEAGTWDDFLKSEELTISKEVSLKKRIGDALVLGIVDEIAIDKDSIFIIDDKPRAKPFNSVKRQITAYCYIFKESFPSSKKLYAVLRDRDSNEIAWKVEYGKELEEDFLLAFHRIRKVLLKEEEAIPTSNSNKCRACQLNQVCERSLVK